MQVEQQPLTALAKKEAGYQAQLSAYGSLKGSLSTFQSALATLSDPAQFSAVSATLSDTTLGTATASTGAMAGNYSVNVTSLAQSQKLQSSSSFASMDTVLGTGTLSISFGTYSTSPDSFTLNPDKPTKSITIAPGQDSLSGVRNAINAANVGISASIINDGIHGNKLVITSKDSGSANALKITVSDSLGAPITDNSGLSQIAYDPASATPISNMTQIIGMEAKNAEMTIDGIPISKSSNTVTDAIQGVTVNLLKTGSSALTVARNLTSAQTAVQSFVAAYNNVNKTISDLSTYDLANKKAAPLTGDSTLLLLKSKLSGILNKPLSTAGGGLSVLSDIGISLQKDGTLSLNTVKLNTVLNDPNKDVSTLFAAVSKPSDGLITFNKSTHNTKNGSYPITISQVSTQGRVTGSALALPFDIQSGTNDELQLIINGKAAAITLSPDSYTESTLASEIQSKINGSNTFSSAGITVSVSASGGILSIISNRYGSESRVVSITGSALPNTFGTIDYTLGTGMDVAGTIGGAAATGNGKTLTASQGSGATGLSITVSGGSTGPRGQVNFARGYAFELNDLVGKILENKSLVDGRVQGINASIKDIGTRRDAFNLRLTAIEQRYRTQFTALDSMLSGMSQTSNFLTQQLANLPGAAK